MSKAEIHGIGRSASAPGGYSAATVFFTAVKREFERAGAAGGLCDRHYRIAGHRIRLRFAGPVLSSLITPAFAHLEVEPDAEPALTICLGDGVSSGIHMPPDPDAMRREDFQVSLWRLRDGRSEIISQLSDGNCHILNTLENLAFYWIDDPNSLFPNETCSPLLLIIHWWMSAHGRHLAHAGAVGSGGRGVLLVGKGGAGKSTVALACLDAGMDYLGDDYCLIENGTVPYAHGLYGSGKLNPEDVALFPRLRPALGNPGKLNGGKAVYFFHRHFRRQMAKGFHVRAIFIPRLQGGGKTNLKRTSGADAFLALAPSTVVQLPGNKERLFHHLGSFVKKVPSYFLEMGPDRAGIAGTIAGFLAEE
jgi:hypothetical protein